MCPVQRSVVPTKYPHVGRETTICKGRPAPPASSCAVYFKTAVVHLFVRLYSVFVKETLRASAERRLPVRRVSPRLSSETLLNSKVSCWSANATQTLHVLVPNASILCTENLNLLTFHSSFRNNFLFFMSWKVFYCDVYVWS